MKAVVLRNHSLKNEEEKRSKRMYEGEKEGEGDVNNSKNKMNVWK